MKSLIKVFITKSHIILQENDSDVRYIIREFKGDRPSISLQYNIFGMLVVNWNKFLPSIQSYKFDGCFYLQIKNYDSLKKVLSNNTSCLMSLNGNTIFLETKHHVINNNIKNILNL